MSYHEYFEKMISKELQKALDDYRAVVSVLEAKKNEIQAQELVAWNKVMSVLSLEARTPESPARFREIEDLSNYL